MQHYFIDKPHNESDFFEFTETFLENEYTFKSCDSIFSKDLIDYGTKTLLETIYKKVDINGRVLDVGCGYGVIGIVLSKLFKDASISMIDINQTAVNLTRHNAIKNHAKNIELIECSNAYEKINDKYDFIITNPPIKAGKENLYNILLGAKEHLNEGGELIFVIKKKHGKDSVKKTLEQNYSFVEVLNRDSGYYIIKAVK